MTIELLGIDEIYDLLVEGSHLDPASVVDGRFRVQQASSRNQTFIVTTDMGGYVVKRADPREPATSSTVSREIQFYRALRGRLVHEGQPLAAEFVDSFDEPPTLVLRLVPDALTLRPSMSRAMADGQIDWLAARLGARLAVLHEIASHPSVRALLTLPQEPPWVLSFARPDTSILATLSAPGAEILRVVQKEPLFAQGLGELFHAWQPSAVIHGDLKAANILVSSRSSRSITFIDWEFVRVGDPAWDVGSLIHEFLISWIGDAERSDAAGSLAGEVLFSATVMRRAASAFWTEYTRSAPACLDRRFMRRCLLSCVARVVQTCHESVAQADRVPRGIALCLQASRNVLADVDQAATNLFGLRTS